MPYLSYYPGIKKIRTILFLLLVISCFPLSGKQPAEILWDKYGVPHIYGNTIAEMYHAFGWAQMHNHADLILKLYGQSRGRGSEYWGEEYLESDRQILLFEIPGHAENNYRLKQEPYRSYLDAFVRGVNDYADANPEAIGDKFRQVLPVTATDVMAHVIRVLCLEFVAWDDFNAIRRKLAPGSNAFAIAPSRSASGNSMLVTNPHLPWHDLHLWFEAHLTGPLFNAYGIALVGTPVLSMAFNDHLGWAFTVNTMDGADTYELNLRRNGYRYDGRVRSFRKKYADILVLQDDGSHSRRPLEFRYSEHGPVTGEAGGKAWALRIVGLNNYGIFEQYHKMGAAVNLAEFEDALRMLQNPMFNIIYADREGNIMYLFNGNVPMRPEGDFAFWRGTVDGTRSEYLWHSVHGYDDLPKVVNPPAGFIQNCNDSPWVSTYPPVLDPDDYPAYMAPHSMSLRPQRAVNLLKKDTSITFEQLISYKMDSGMEAADRFLDDLLEAVDQYPDPTAAEAAAVLRAWDGKTDRESRGAVLFANWFDKLRHRDFEVSWSPEDPVNTPRGLKEPERAVDLLARVAEETRQQYGALDIPWGNVHRLRAGDKDFPANGGPDRYGILHTMEYMNDSDSTKRAFHGETYIAVTEFSNPVRAKVLLGYGNASQPGSRHTGGQLGSLSAKQLRPALLDRNDILENLEKRELIYMDQLRDCANDL